MKNTNRALGKAAEFHVCGVLSDRGLLADHVGNQNRPGVDLLVRRHSRSQPMKIEVKSTNSNVVTIPNFYSYDNHLYVIAQRVRRNSYNFFTIPPSELEPLIEQGIGFLGKDGVKLSRLARFKDPRLAKVLPEQSRTNVYLATYLKCRGKIDFKARKQDGTYGWGYDFGKINKEAHRQARKIMKGRDKK